MTPNQLKAYRKTHSLSTTDIAAICGVSRRTVEDWEQGRHQPSRAACMLLTMDVQKRKGASCQL